MPEHLTPKLVNWASIIEDNTRHQAITSSEMPFVFPHLALMPDAHLGKGATVGSVIPTDRAIMPAAVGVDIGCGMIAVRTQWTRGQLAAAGPLARLRVDIERRVPLSAGKYSTKLTDSAASRAAALDRAATDAGFDPARYAGNWRLQLGSLGGGNHFLEVTLDELDRVWLFLHSGSRGVGNKIAQHHIRVAQDSCARQKVDLPDRDLAYLFEDTPQFDRYIAELRWAQAFALANREEMMDRLVAAISRHVGEAVDEQQRINCHHNFTEHEHHFGRDLWISRKGAIKAGAGDWGLIPGSMGTASYVVQGLGNPLSFNSSPHGAGRSYGRKHAERTFTYEQLVRSMEGIEWSRSKAFLDEIPAAYKDIDQVLADAADLVQIRHTLRQVLNVKGA